MDKIDIIKELMHKKGINQTELTKLSNLHYATVNKILNRKQDLFPNTLQKIATALDVEIWEITGGDNNPTLDLQVKGYLEFGGEIKKISSFSELEKWTIKTKEIVKQLPKEVAAIERTEAKSSNKVLKYKTKIKYSFDTINLFKEDEYDTTKLNCWSFRKSDDERENLRIDLGNMCKGYPFSIYGKAFHNSEAAYIAGMFSNGSEEHNSIQIELQNEKNGYAAKKKIRNKYENIKRTDWETFNVQWMLFVVWQKCLINEQFKELLITIPTDAMIVENSTKQTGTTTSFWGAKNFELEDCRDKIEAYHKYKNPNIKDKDLMLERNKINHIGIFKGVNCMGKILKLCQIAILNNTEPPINYDLLKSRDIHLLGDLLVFDKEKITI